MSEEASFELDEHQAFTAMSLFVNRFAERAGDDLLTLLGDITLRNDGSTFDPAAWYDWLECVRDVKGAGDELVDEIPSDG
ncbi:MAG: hypothetical protein ACC652_13185 [Acidimicrobiales bacterium]